MTGVASAAAYLRRREWQSIANRTRPLRISGARFSQKSGFGERRSDMKPVSMKIFLLPKTATQSPRNTLSVAIDGSRRHRMRIDRTMCE
jgi:hypothetical protein